jgi:hypothetical protein
MPAFEFIQRIPDDKRPKDIGHPIMLKLGSEQCARNKFILKILGDVTISRNKVQG